MLKNPAGLVLATLCLFVSTISASPDDVISAPHASLPAVKSAALREALLHAIPQETVASYIDAIDQVLVFDEAPMPPDFDKSAPVGDKTLLIGSGVDATTAPEDLFGDGIVDADGRAIRSSAVVSLDAFALRLVVDLSQLRDDEDVWVVDPTVPRAFGPYRRDDHREGGRWLATVEGDTAVLVARSESGNRPLVGLLGLSHFFRGFESAAKELSCNINIACEDDATIQSASTAVGIMLVPVGSGYYSALCTGSLINNSDTEEFEPYFLTSWHCVPDAADADQVDVVWDYRATACGTNDPPSIGSLPRSSGESLLASSSTYDVTLMGLDSVPGGDMGRTYLGWTTATPSLGADIIGIHHPEGTHMRISYGTVVGLDEAASRFLYQTKVHWDEGVTEHGSSGNPLLLVDAGYVIIGTLSNGPIHSCSSNVGNVDWYSSFRYFYDQVDTWLTGGDPTQQPDTGGCPANKSLAAYPEVLAQLRLLRDKGLSLSPLGNTLVDAYYRAAPVMADRVERSVGARDAFTAVTAPFASLGSREAQLQTPASE